jgi:hypothetical protein
VCKNKGRKIRNKGGTGFHHLKRPYYRVEPTRTLFAETLVSQTLANIKAALEME